MTDTAMTGTAAPRLELDPADKTYLNELSDFVAVPSISRDASKDTMQTTAQWLSDRLAFAAGRVVPAKGHPGVLGEWHGRPGAPTILVYGHYDVQPVGDPGEWATPPFRLCVAGRVMRGRGASDDQGPVYVAIKPA